MMLMPMPDAVVTRDVEDDEKKKGEDEDAEADEEENESGPD